MLTMHTQSILLSGRPATVQLRRQAVAPAKQRSVSNPRLLIRAAYDVEAEPLPPRAPNAAPRFGGGAPPPPPPPPPPPAQKGLQPPSRRELLFGFLGLGVGVAGTYAADNWPLEQASVDEKLASILDDLLEDEAILDLLGEEIINRRTLQQGEGYVSMLEDYAGTSEKIDELIRQIDEVEAAEAAASAARK